MAGVSGGPRPRRGRAPKWWIPSWDNTNHPDASFVSGSGELWHTDASAVGVDDEVILAPLEAQFGGQVRSRERVRDLAEVFTHSREVTAILDQIPDAFTVVDVKFLEPACGSGNFLTEIVRRKLALVSKATCASQEQYEHQLLRALASIYGVDISPENITEARARMAHTLLEFFQQDANTITPTSGFVNAAALILGANIVCGDTLTGAREIELCDWQPRSGGCFVRVWSAALVPAGERDLFWEERIQDAEPVHYSQLAPELKVKKAGARKPGGGGR